MKAIRFRLEGDVGYIRVTSFTEQSTSGVLDAVEKIKKEAGTKLKGYVLDLRNNPGGLLDQAISMVDAFLDKGEIVSVKARKAEDVQRWNAKPGDIDRRPADRGADERRLGLGLGDRGRRPAGSSPRDRSRHPLVRQRLGADHHAGDRRRRDPPHHGALLHAVGPLDPEGRHQARHRGRAGQGRDDPAARRLPRGEPAPLDHQPERQAGRRQEGRQDVRGQAAVDKPADKKDDKTTAAHAGRRPIRTSRRRTPWPTTSCCAPST